MTRGVRMLLVPLAVAGVLALAACAPTDAPAQDPPSAQPTSPSPTPDPSVSAIASAPRCESILPDSTVADFASLGWSARSEPLTVGSTEIIGGVVCTWGNFSVASDHVQVYGWGPIDQARTDALVAELVAQGWQRDDTDGGIHLLEPAIGGVRSEFALSYLFGDGQVRLADTEQGLILVEDPRG